MSRKIFWLVFCAFLAACNPAVKGDLPVDEPKTSTLKKKKTGKKKIKQEVSIPAEDSLALLNKEDVIELVKSIPEIREADLYIDSISNHAYRISMIVEEPSDTEPMFFIRVGLDNETRFETYFLLYLDPKTKAIAVEDPLVAGDERLDLDTWRKLKLENL